MNISLLVLALASAGREKRCRLVVGAVGAEWVRSAGVVVALIPLPPLTGKLAALPLEVSTL